MERVTWECKGVKGGVCVCEKKKKKTKQMREGRWPADERRYICGCGVWWGTNG